MLRRSRPPWGSCCRQDACKFYSSHSLTQLTADDALSQNVQGASESMRAAVCFASRPKSREGCRIECGSCMVRPQLRRCKGSLYPPAFPMTTASSHFLTRMSLAIRPERPAHECHVGDSERRQARPLSTEAIRTRGIVPIRINQPQKGCRPLDHKWASCQHQLIHR